MIGKAQTADGYISVPGGRVWFRATGQGAGIPLLVLHGGPGMPHDYLDPLSSLSDARAVVFYDQLGCGRADRPHDPSLWRADRFEEELRVVRRTLGLDRVHIYGHSWGSMLAVEHCLAGADGVESLILASAPLSMPRWLDDTSKYRSALPTGVQETLARHERAGTTDSSEYQAAGTRLRAPSCVQARSLAGRVAEFPGAEWRRGIRNDVGCQ